MKFAKVVFWIAGIWGLLMISPLYFLFDAVGRKDPPPITHPGFYYGFVGTALAWQICFCIIATDPIRFRPIMLAGIVEKIAYAAAIVFLVHQGRTNHNDLIFAATDFTLAILFVVSYIKTKRLPTQL